MSRVEKSIDIRADMATVQEVISDYEHYPAFVPHVQATEILDGSDASASNRRVRFTVNLIKRIRYTLDLHRSNGQGLTWTLVDGPFEHNEGGWRLRELAPDRTRATYFIDARVTALLPGFLEKRLIAQSLPETLHAFQAESERRQKTG